MFTRNQVQLTGRVTKPAETRSVGDTVLAKARLIHNERIRRSDGDAVERVVAMDLEIWGKRGEAFAEYVTTKTPVFIEGRLQLDEWEQDGEPRSRLRVRVDDWQFLTWRQSEEPQSEDERGRGRRGERDRRSPDRREMRRPERRERRAVVA
jgi:single-strand DNA-binding protein